MSNISCQTTFLKLKFTESDFHILFIFTKKNNSSLFITILFTFLVKKSCAINLSMRRDLNPHAKGSCIWSNRVCQFHHSWLNHSLIFNEKPMLLDPRFLVYPLGMTGTCSLISSSNKSSVLPSSEISRWVDSNHQPRNFKFPCSAVGIHRGKGHIIVSLFLEGLFANLYFVSKGVDAQAKNLKTIFDLVWSRTKPLP